MGGGGVGGEREGERYGVVARVLGHIVYLLIQILYLTSFYFLPVTDPSSLYKASLTAGTFQRRPPQPLPIRLSLRLILSSTVYNSSGRRPVKEALYREAGSVTGKR